MDQAGKLQFALAWPKRQPVSDEKKLFCPECKTWYPATHFECLPLDLRCNRCIPVEAAMVLYDKKKEKAGQIIAQILDGSEGEKSLRPVERMLVDAYEAFGGPKVFMEKVMGWINDLASNPRTKPAAVNAAMKIISLHGKVDRNKMENDWRQMDTDTLRDALERKLRGILEEKAASAVKMAATKYLTD